MSPAGLLTTSIVRTDEPLDPSGQHLDDARQLSVGRPFTNGYTDELGPLDRLGIFGDLQGCDAEHVGDEVSSLA